MEELNSLPFFNITSNDDLLLTLWNDPCDNLLKFSCTPELVLEPLCDLSNDLQTGIKSYPSKYITMDELTNSATSNTSSNNFTVSQINTRSIKRNFDAFRVYVSAFKSPPQVLTVSETWLKDGEEIYYSLPNYKFISLPRNNSK